MAEEALRDHKLQTGLVPLGMSLKGPPVLHTRTPTCDMLLWVLSRMEKPAIQLAGFSFLFKSGNGTTAILS